MTAQLTVLELRSAENYLVKKAQAESFSEEMLRLERGQEIHKQSRLTSLDPRLEDGYLVVGGRLQKPSPYHTVHDTLRSLTRVTNLQSSLSMRCIVLTTIRLLSIC